MKNLITAYQAPNAKSKLSPFTYEPRPRSENDILIRITHCGICHSDLHLIDDDWSYSEYPLVPGHEIIGIVEEKGNRIDHLNVGDRVGVGWQSSSCMACEWCLVGDENLCEQSEATCVVQPGGFADAIVTDGRFAFPIPKSLPSEYAAPLLCGGVTVFSPFVEHKIRPTHKVAIVGIGGLGHLALQFASAMGCDVTAFSSTPEKETQAKEFGADHFICTKDPSALESHENTFDFILSSSTHGLNWATFVAALRPRGRICLLGALEQSLEAQITTLVHGRKSICGSNIGSRPDIKKMLNFAARHQVYPEIEKFPMEKVNEAIAKLRAGKMRYRAVLFNQNT